MFDFAFDLTNDWRRRWRLRKAPAGPLATALAAPLPRRAEDYRTVEFVALDLETTGLNPARDQILSLGWVLLRGHRIDLSSAEHRILRLDGTTAIVNAEIHRITDDQAAAGQPLAEALAALLPLLAGRVLIAHHARIERGFLGAACRRLYGQRPVLRVIDTQALARRTFARRQIEHKASDLRLHALAERYNLPRLSAHHALADALTTAELFLAQAAYQEARGNLPLGDLFC